MENKVIDKDEISEEIVNLVIARLETMPSNVSVSIGDTGSFTVEELIKSVKNRDEIGEKIIEIQISYLRSLSKIQEQENDTPNN